SGLLIPLDELIENHTVYMKQYFADSPDVLKQYTAPDGHIYTLPKIFFTLPLESEKYNHYAYLIRKDWLDQLGLDVPSTMDELRDTLTAFRDQDPSGTGNTIPWSPANLDNLASLGWMYGLHLFVNQGFYPDDNGKIVYEWML